MILKLSADSHFSARNLIFLKINVKKMKRFIFWLLAFTVIPEVGRLLEKGVYYKFLWVEGAFIRWWASIEINTVITHFKFQK